MLSSPDHDFTDDLAVNTATDQDLEVEVTWGSTPGVNPSARGNGWAQVLK